MDNKELITKVLALSKEAGVNADTCKSVPYDSGFYVGQEEAFDEVLTLLGFKYPVTSNTFVSMLPKDQQDEIIEFVRNHFTEDGYTTKEINDIIENVKVDRLWNVEEIMDISKYLTK